MSTSYYVIAFLLLYNADVTCSKVRYYITSSSNDSCPDNFCLTLSQYSANYHNITTNEMDVSLILLPGNHVLERKLSVSHKDKFSVKGGRYAFVKCNGPSGRINIGKTKFVSIKNLQFTGCKHNKVTQVARFVLKHTSFQNVEAKGQGGVASDSLTTGGALHIRGSNVWIVNSNFTNNSADYGGVLHAEASSVHIADSFFGYNRATEGGVMETSDSSVTVINCTFLHNEADTCGGVIYSDGDSYSITDCNFSGNSAHSSGVLDTYASVVSISNSSFSNNSGTITNSIFVNNSVSHDSGVMWHISNFTNNSADYGGVLYAEASSVNIADSFFGYNRASEGGVMNTYNSSVNVISCNFTNNEADSYGGVMYSDNDIYSITKCSFNGNSAHTSGVMDTRTSTVSISNCSFSNNSAAFFSGIISVEACSLVVKTTTFYRNKADDTGGIMRVYESIFEISNSNFANNNALSSGVMDIVESFGTITDSSFVNNSASHDSGVMWCVAGFLVVENSVFQHNKADKYGGVALTTNCSVNFSNNVFEHNLGSLYHIFSRVVFSGYTVIKNNAEMSGYTTEVNQVHHFQEGGAITSFQSTITFMGNTSLVNNVARSGGAILATGSRIISYGEITVSNNTATNNNGGGVSLSQSTLKIHGDCYISHNHGGNGGGIHASSSYITVYEPEGVLHLQNNTAENGGGLYLDLNSKLFIQKHYDTVEDILIFSGNYAKYGGAVYVADETNTNSCSQNVECFIQVLSTFPEFDGVNVNKSNIVAFSKNTATSQGSDLFGGLLDRCLSSPFSEVNIHHQIHYKGTIYLRKISNITFNSTTSLPIRVCFCNKKGFQDCDYQLPAVQVKKGETFTVSLVAVDQINHSIYGNIISSLASQDASLGTGQHTQKVNNSCTEIQLSVFSPHKSEKVTFSADGPCGISTLSSQSLSIQFLNCTCPIGFEHSNTMTSSCRCVCDSELSPYVANCNSSTKSLLLRTNSSAWINYINNTDPSGYVIHPNCPFDYCLPRIENRSINFILTSGADAQCAHNRVGTLCGTCQQNLSLSLGSSVCLQCTAHWPAYFIVICLTSIICGILLVTFILFLNMTVSVGLINSFIFYANIVGSSSTILYPLSQSRFARVFVAWLNLDIGIDVCFYDGLDTYTKMWFQLAFPLYIISLVLIIIKASEHSPKFTRLIGRKDPIATLATLILLSYAKLLSVTIMVLSYTVLHYPDGSKGTVWLTDGSVEYFQGKHIPLAIVALLIIILGIPFTFLLFFWQWLIQVPKKWKIFNWTRNTRLIGFLSTYNAPYNSKYRFWTGLLLLVRVILYTTASVTVSVDPLTLPLTTATLVGGLLLLKGAIGSRVYKKSLIDILETVLYFNILALALFCLYGSKSDNKAQTSVAYISTSITFTLLAVTVMYHVRLLIRRKPGTSVEVKLTPPSQATLNKSEVTVSVVDLPSALGSN